MPIYGYECSKCHHAMDVLQKFSDPALVDCPECGKATLQKQLSAPKFRLKGKGWYETDFKTGDKRNIAGEADTKDTKDTKDTNKTSKDSDKPKKADTTAAKTDSKASSA